ncbi:MAG: hypothetical protein MSC30_15475 [Gaiellaceae bacterium MAG52_C11]|nr:hypothetical protein [Candidatus Gaiellasilicea maunaloa]
MNWRTRRRLAVLLLALTGSLAVAASALGQEITPPPPSVGTNVPASYFGPFPSQIDRKLVGPVQLLRSGTLDVRKATIEIPLYLGHLQDGRNVWYILTDTTDKDNAEALGLNHSAKMHYGNIGRATRVGRLDKEAGLIFDKGAVDFSPKRMLVPGKGANAFPPSVAHPGSVGDADYTPFVRIENAGGHVYNAPVIAFDKTAAQIRACNGKQPNYDLVHDRVARICPEGNGGGTVTINLTGIFSFAKPSLYMSMEASDPMVATLDNATFAPAIGELPVGRDDSVFSAIERLFVIANGPTGRLNPQRQGLNSALTDTGPDGKPLPPLNLVGGLPTVALDYSPAWDLNLGFWTAEAIRKGYRSRVIDEFQLLGYVVGGHITGPMGKPFGSTGIVVNCPIVARLL